MAVRTIVNVSVRAEETGTGGLGTPTEIHESGTQAAWPSGAADSKADLVWSSSGTLTATTLDLDLNGALTTKVTGAVNFAKLSLIRIKNKATATGANLLVGGGINPIASLWGSAGDILKIPPGGAVTLEAPIDGYAVTASTADILRLDSGTATIPYEILIVGRTA